MIEIESLDELGRATARAQATTGSMSGWQVQGLDLTSVEDALLGLAPRGALFLGCTLSDETADRLRSGGALLFPEVPDVPFDPWRPALYTSAELYDGLDEGYAHTTDATVYAWSQQVHAHASLKDLLAQSLHDGSIDDALHELVRGRRIIGVMGGHALTRDHPDYAAAAHLARELAAAGFTVATGGGPGAMEAANLGATLGEQHRGTLDEVLERVATVPSFADDVTAWARVGLDAVAGLGDSGRSLGIPTWHYGHEPPNPFCSAVAKYFRNAIREDILLQVCGDGIVFLPGAAGTVQEIFQAACSNYYAPPGQTVPMVFVGEDHWTRQLPAWPLVRALASGRSFDAGLDLVDSASEVLSLFLHDR